MVSVYDIYPNEAIERVAQELKSSAAVKPPKWAAFAKTGVHKERPPANKDWWYIRAAAVLRSVYRLGPVGVSKLRVKYGGKKNRGVAKERSYKGSGNILRKILQQLEKEGYVIQSQKGVHKGRVATPKGISLLDRATNKVKVPIPKQEKKPAKKSANLDAHTTKADSVQSNEAGAQKK